MNLTKIWNSTLGTMQVQTSRHEFNTWLRRATLLSVDNGIATIGAPSAFFKEGLENRYAVPLRDLISQLIGFPVQVRVVIASPQPVSAENRLTSREYGKDDDMPDFEQAPAYNPASTNGNGYANGHASDAGNRYERLNMQQLEFSSSMRSGMLNARYTFDRFIVGSSNRLANAACMAVAEHPAQAYNPLFLYGGVGLGKTHLLHAIGNYALDRDPEINVLYVSSEKFTNDLINAIRRQQTEEFRIRYRNIDILLIDDIQFIAGKESTQEEFFHTFNTLHSAGKQIVISSDRPPKAILTLEERLRSRFEWGLIVDVQTPDLETRTAILRAKAEQMSMHIPPEVIDFLAHRIQSNIRELEGCLNRVAAYAQMYGTAVSVEVATAALNELLDTSRRKRLTTDAILREVADFYGVDLRAMQGRGRSRNIVVPRQVAMYLLREETDASLMDIGQMLGGRDHTTVIYGCEKIGEEINSDSRLRQEVVTIRDRLYQAM
ncbi:MAG TPA: chromosomal replication initiator protein DnaA [Kouleothrix sp.]|uniref:chromosomal replication initiator protein DnaA n=1 Tax=Kouleothrix sp. TaxID=2779161 RepID=UPI002C4E80EA|nr:chromosomal replication initiator protein DnaA [Kouleothrix sp.]